jgi:hypothetical protein
MLWRRVHEDLGLKELKVWVMNELWKKVVQVILMCNILKYPGWMMETTMINLAVLLMLSNLCHSPVTRPHLGGCFLALAAGGVHKHSCDLMSEYQSPTFSSFR